MMAQTRQVVIVGNEYQPAAIFPAQLPQCRPRTQLVQLAKMRMDDRGGIFSCREDRPGGIPPVDL